MARSRKLLTTGALGVAAVALLAATAGTTGAYFSDAKGGNIAGTIGSVKLSAGDTTFAWTNMMPGEKQTATVDFTNIGTGPQDFYIVFPNVPALHALNNLGSYGEVQVTGGPTSNTQTLFASKNLQDGRHKFLRGGVLIDNTDSCGGFSPTGCWPLPVNLPIASNVAKGATGTVSFSFTYDGRLGNGTSGGVGSFNSFPLSGNDVWSNAAGDADAAAPAGAGLPFKIVATQVGQKP